MKGEGAMADIGHDALFLTPLLRFSQRSHFNASFHIRSYL